MRTRSISSIAALAALTVAFAGCSTNAGTPGPSSDGGGLEDFEAVSLTVSINEPEGVLNDYARDYFAEIEEASEGKISFELFYAGSLLPGDQVLGGVADGLADIGQITPTFYPDQLPIASWFQGLGFMAAKGWPLGALSEAGAA